MRGHVFGYELTDYHDGKWHPSYRECVFCGKRKLMG